jgi:hypothetical protein
VPKGKKGFLKNKLLQEGIIRIEDMGTTIAVGKYTYKEV